MVTVDWLAKLSAGNPKTAPGGQARGAIDGRSLVVGTGARPAQGGPALVKTGVIAKVGGRPGVATWLPADRFMVWVLGVPEGLATDMPDPGMALVTETAIPVGRLGRQSRFGSAGPMAVQGRQSIQCAKVGAFALVTKKGHKHEVTAVAKVEALARMEAIVKD